MPRSIRPGKPQGSTSPRQDPPRTSPSRRPVRPALAVVQPPANLRGYKRLALLRDLAMGERSNRELATIHGITAAQVTLFANDHEQEIQELSQALSGSLSIDTAGLWITKKQNRLAELEHEAEEIRQALQDLRDDGYSWSRSHRDMIRTYLEVLKTAADELGAYPQRQSAPARSGSTVHYVIDTEDSDSLR